MFLTDFFFGCQFRREATPPGDHSDQESSKAADHPKHHRRRSSATVPCRARMPPAKEIEEFFAAAEKAEAERFAARYVGIPFPPSRCKPSAACR
jgi:hypothetical protein